MAAASGVTTGVSAAMDLRGIHLKRVREHIYYHASLQHAGRSSWRTFPGTEDGLALAIAWRTAQVQILHETGRVGDRVPPVRTPIPPFSHTRPDMCPRDMCANVAGVTVNYHTKRGTTYFYHRTSNIYSRRVKMFPMTCAGLQDAIAWRVARLPD